jgi:hypothetical protein
VVIAVATKVIIVVATAVIIVEAIAEATAAEWIMNS